MIRGSLDLSFKGQRDYLHGTDLLDASVRWLGARPDAEALREIDFSCHRPARRQVDIFLDEKPAGQEACAVVAFGRRAGRRRAYLVEGERPVLARRPYPEEQIVASMHLDSAARSASLQVPQAYSDIEIWVALAKALHQRLLPEPSGRWWFVRGRFPAYPPAERARTVTLRLAASFNERLTRCALALDGGAFGEIYFADA